MTESFLHYLWQFQYLDKKDLVTTAGEHIEVFHPGIKNSHSGPDFSNARVRIGQLEWRGSVEIHINASGWHAHHHDDDPAYENVILHVVWEDDKPIVRLDNSPMPTLELKKRIDLNLWDRYRRLFASAESVPCAKSWPSVDDFIKHAMLDRVLVQRLETKAIAATELLEHVQGDWEETCYQLLFRNFGFKVNNDPFLQLAQGLPYNIIRKHINNPLQVEALMFGLAGFLEKVKEDEYSNLLKREYNLFQKKYGLEKKQMHKSQWRFLRLRPANFPTVRLAQLASLIVSRNQLFSAILDTENYKEFYSWLNVAQSEYWKSHYQFGKKSESVPSLGKSSVQNIIINTIVPLLAAYSLTHDDQRYMDRAVGLLQHIPAEKNTIIKRWQELGYTVKTAFDSQALIELHNSFCMKRRCLECNVGASLIRP